ncbi:MAG: DUF2344 domain-containing protein, partial [Candidatus Competibacteraceae bacterium]|nr:DUF2344 domain-containing protein [Candidatus Competibacteraceae bacterium]
HAAIEETGYDYEFQFRERGLDDRLPWDHIDVLIDKEWFQADWKRALELRYAQDCRAGKCHLCGVIYRERELCKSMLKNQKAGHKEEADTWEGIPEKSETQPDAVQRIRFRIGRIGETRFLSHLELKDAWVRSLRRARTPLAYTQGFHAQPRINFSTALPLGEETLGEYMDVMLKEYTDPKDLFARLSTTLPPGLRVLEIYEMPLRGPSLMSLVDGFEYTLHAEADADAITARIEEVLAADTVTMTRRAKAGSRPGRGNKKKIAKHAEVELNIRPMIESLSVANANARQVEIRFTTISVGGKLAKPKDIVELLGLDAAATRVVKQTTRLREDADAMAEFSGAAV